MERTAVTTGRGVADYVVDFLRGDGTVGPDHAGSYTKGGGTKDEALGIHSKSRSQRVNQVQDRGLTSRKERKVAKGKGTYNDNVHNS